MEQREALLLAHVFLVIPITVSVGRCVRFSFLLLPCEEKSGNVVRHPPLAFLTFVPIQSIPFQSRLGPQRDKSDYSCLITSRGRMGTQLPSTNNSQQIKRVALAIILSSVNLQ
jgi:hypothetical protein